jgi:hypothetical protein
MARQATRAGVGVTISVVQSCENPAGANLHKNRWPMDTVRTATCRGKEVNPTTRRPRRYQSSAIKTVGHEVLSLRLKGLALTDPW